MGLGKRSGGRGGCRRWRWARVGFLFLTVGAVGLVLPLWPTTIFWIIAAFCLAESHPSVRDWIYARPGVGPIIQNFIEDGMISRKSKTAAIGGMMIAGAISAWFLQDTLIGLSAMAVAILVGIAFVATRREV